MVGQVLFVSGVLLAGQCRLGMVQVVSKREGRRRQGEGERGENALFCYYGGIRASSIRYSTYCEKLYCTSGTAPPINHQSKIDAERRNVHHFTRLLRHEQYFFGGEGAIVAKMRTFRKSLSVLYRLQDPRSWQSG